MNKKLVISVDFDNTIFTEVYPGCGELIDGARETINWLYSLGHTIIINTCREGVHAEVAMSALTSHGVNWHYFNTNDPDKCDKFGADCRKISCDIDIDDKSIWSLSKGKQVNWKEVRSMLEQVIPKPTIVCVVGQSGTGKTHMVNYLEDTYGIPMIESRTTRAPRFDGERGHTFVSDEEFDSYRKEDMLAFTEFGGKRYCCLSSDINADIVTYVIDEFGLQYLKKHFSDKFNIFAVRMFANDSLIAKRVDADRIQRDKGKFTLGSEHFDLFIDNDYSPKMISKYDNLYKKIINVTNI